MLLPNKINRKQFFSNSSFSRTTTVDTCRSLPLTRLFLTLLLILLSGCDSQPIIKEAPKTIDSPQAATPLSLGDSATLENALSRMSEKKWKQAIKPLKKLKRKYPNNLMVTINLATSYYAEKNIDQAESLCLEALKLNKESVEANNLFGLIAIERRKFSSAETAYKKAISVNSSFANAHYNLALLYDMYFQDIPKAYQHYQHYLTLVPDDQNVKDWVEQLKYSLDQY